MTFNGACLYPPPMRLTKVDARGPHSHRLYVRNVKPTIDVITAVVLGILLLPVTAVVATAVAARLGRPVIYRQTRIGIHGEEFTMFKFRTMTHDRRTLAEPPPHQERRVSFEAMDDPRHTPLGRWLRAWSLDELPQLWNIIRGDMSFVGPRPEVREVVAAYETWQHQRHLVRPGITGLWQVSARDVKPMHANVGIDVDYVQRVSFRLDCRILMLTPPAVLREARRPTPIASPPTR